VAPPAARGQTEFPGGSARCIPGAFGTPRPVELSSPGPHPWQHAPTGEAGSGPHPGSTDEPVPAKRKQPATRKPRPRAWRVYLLRCRDGSLYGGCTNDLTRRVAAHAAGKGARYTRSRLPVALVWSARAKDRGAALRREAALKRLTRAEKLALVGRGRPRR